MISRFDALCDCWSPEREAGRLRLRRVVQQELELASRPPVSVLPVYGAAVPWIDAGIGLKGGLVGSAYLGELKGQLAQIVYRKQFWDADGFGVESGIDYSDAVVMHGDQVAAFQPKLGQVCGIVGEAGCEGSALVVVCLRGLLVLGGGGTEVLGVVELEDLGLDSFAHTICSVAAFDGQNLVLLVANLYKCLQLYRKRHPLEIGAAQVDPENGMPVVESELEGAEDALRDRFAWEGVGAYYMLVPVRLDLG